MSEPSGPRRLVDDPTFASRFGVDLRGEAAALTADLGRARARVDAGVTLATLESAAHANGLAETTAATRGSGTLGILGSARGFLVGTALGVIVGGGAVAVLRPPPVERARSSLEQRSPERIEAGAPAPERNGEAAPFGDTRPGSTTALAVSNPSAASGNAERETRRNLAPIAPTSSIAQEQALYERAELARKTGNCDAALRDLDAAVRRFPNGALHAEVQLSRLQCLRSFERFRDVVAATDVLLREPSLAGRGAELHRIRAEALARLGRCGEVARVPLDPDVRAAILQTCRAPR